MSKWFPFVYDKVMKLESATKVNKARKELIDLAYGRVLEIGSGTGMNFPLYKRAIYVDALEPDTHMIIRAHENVQRASIPLHMHNMTAEQMDFPEDTFDSVVNTLVFCTIPNPEKALENIQRVAKPYAPILFLEHVRMKQHFLARTQDVLTPMWKRMADGCRLNRDTLEMIKASGLKVKQVQTFYRSLVIAVVCENEK